MELNETEWRKTHTLVGESTCCSACDQEAEDLRSLKFRNSRGERDLGWTEILIRIVYSNGSNNRILISNAAMKCSNFAR